MIHAQKGAIAMTPALTTASNATQTMHIDTKGYDYAKCLINVGTHSTTGTGIQTITFSESDTITSPSSMTDIVALTCGTATSTSVGVLIPAVTVLGFGAVLEFDIDLRKRKRYLGLEITPGTTTVNVSATIECTREEQSADTATEKSLSNGNLTNATLAQVTIV